LYNCTGEKKMKVYGKDLEVFSRKTSYDDVLFIPRNEYIEEHGYFTNDGIVGLLRKYNTNPTAIRFIADMLE
jgi:hypothetical protein